MRDFDTNKAEIQTMLAAGDFLKDDATVHCFEDVVNKSIRSMKMTADS